ncbi:hypothetical protein ACJ73_02566 [Blastomyces percursus]|uniref:Uncharacterized protein n=1 Tax=Blastomyces percursus TaxID=1658174 RepID=A0A1J9QC19_9EURO|nr:hypothetical protein ACJ73_02566 [Blastomyces percursus]
MYDNWIFRLKKIKGYMQEYAQGSSSPTNRAMNQLVKGCRMAMYNATILAKENKQLRAANEKQKRKRQRGCTYIAEEGVLTVREGMDRIQPTEEERSRVVEASNSRPQKRAASRCTLNAFRRGWWSALLLGTAQDSILPQRLEINISKLRPQAAGFKVGNAFPCTPPAAAAPS